MRSLGCSSIARASNLGLGTPLCSPAGSSLDARTCSSGFGASRGRLSISHMYAQRGGDRRNGDEEHEAIEEKEEGEFRFHRNQDTSNEAVEALGHTSSSASTPKDAEWGFRQQVRERERWVG